MKNLNNLLFAGIVVAPLVFGSVSTANAGAAGDCVTGAVVGSFMGWTVAVVLAPFTAGSSLALGPTVDVVLASGAAGCVLTVTGNALAAKVDDDYKNSNKQEHVKHER